MSRKAIVLCGFAASVVLGGANARASFLQGKQVTIEEAGPLTTNINYSWGPYVVGTNSQFSVTNSPPLINFSASVTDDSITFTFLQSAQATATTFNGYVLKVDSTGVAPFESVSVDPSTTLAGFSQSRLSFDATDVYINNEGLSITNGQSETIDFSPVPEPASFGIVACGGAMALCRRRRRA